MSPAVFGLASTDAGMLMAGSSADSFCADALLLANPAWNAIPGLTSLLLMLTDLSFVPCLDLPLCSNDLRHHSLKIFGSLARTLCSI